MGPYNITKSDSRIGALVGQRCGLRATLGIDKLSRMFTLSRMKHRVLAVSAACLLWMGAVATAQKPKENISAGRHPNLAAAQRLSQQAWEKINAAQSANEWDMQGHAKKAKELLDEVNRELKMAAESANKR